MSKLSCVAPNCKMRTFNISREQENLILNKFIISFHKFPSDAERRKIWTNAIGKQNWIPNCDSVVCSLHFNGDCYNDFSKLQNSAVPSVFFDDFETHLKQIMDVSKKEIKTVSNVTVEKNVKNLKLINSKEDENIEMSISALSDSDDYEIECEEILFSDDDTSPSTSLTQDVDVVVQSPIKSSKSTVKLLKSPEKCPKSSTNPSKSSASNHKSNSVASKSDTPRSAPSSTSSSNDNDSHAKLESIIPLVKNDTSERARQLYSMIQSGSYKNFSVMQPASKNVVCQLLEIVKLANVRNAPNSSAEDAVPNTYIITTKQDDLSSSKIVKFVDTKEVIATIGQTIQSIKNGTFENSDELMIICGSPAIFLIKYVSVKNFDANMNAVYVITSENLLPYLYLLSTQAKPSRQVTSSTLTSSSLPSPYSKNTSLISKVSSSIQKPIVTKKIQKSSLSPSRKNSTGTENTQRHASSSSLTPAAIKNIQQPVSARSSIVISAPTTKVSAQKRLTSSNLNSTQHTSSASLTSSASQTPKLGSTSSNIVRKNVIVPLEMKKKLKSRLSLSSSKIPITDASRLPKTSTQSTLPVVSVSVSASDMCNSNIKNNKIQTRSNPSSSVAAQESNIQNQQSLPLKTSPVKLAVNISPLKRKSVDATVTSSPKRSTISLKEDVGPSKTFPSKPKISVRNLEKESSSILWTVPAPGFTFNNATNHAVDTENNLENNVEEIKLSPASLQRVVSDQRVEIRSLEQSIIDIERETLSLKKKLTELKKRCQTLKKQDSKSDSELVEDILKKYFDNDAVQFFIGQMKVAGKTFTQYRWSEEDKLFAVGLLYKNPVEYNVLFQRFTLPSDKTLNKFVARIKKFEMDVKK